MSTWAKIQYIGVKFGELIAFMSKRLCYRNVSVADIFNIVRSISKIMWLLYRASMWAKCQNIEIKISETNTLRLLQRKTVRDATTLKMCHFFHFAVSLQAERMGHVSEHSNNKPHLPHGR